MKMKNRMRYLLFICIVLMVFTGCSTKKNQQEQANQGQTPQETEAAKVTAEVTPTPTSTPTPEVTQEAISADPDYQAVDDNVSVTVEKVNLREEASTEAAIVAKLPKGSLLKRIGIGSEWSKVIYEEKECYVSNELIAAAEETPDQDADSEDPAITGEAADTTGGGKIVIIDPGHQGSGDSTQEPIGPGASETKGRVTSGTSGSVSGWAEYELNLAVSLKLRDELVNRGYTVHMTRETHDINISNKERAEFAAQQNGDILVRIHANGSDDSSVNGALCMAPTSENGFLAAELIAESQRLSQSIIDHYVAATGFNNQGVYKTDEMSGINWSTMPVTIVEMGYMSNTSDDSKMADPAMQEKMVAGISDGVDGYFGN